MDPSTSKMDLAGAEDAGMVTTQTYCFFLFAFSKLSDVLAPSQPCWGSLNQVLKLNLRESLYERIT